MAIAINQDEGRKILEHHWKSRNYRTSTNIYPRKMSPTDTLRKWLQENFRMQRS